MQISQDGQQAEMCRKASVAYNGNQSLAVHQVQNTFKVRNAPGAPFKPYGPQVSFSLIELPHSLFAIDVWTDSLIKRSL